jgi:hypothetical protein
MVHAAIIRLCALAKASATASSKRNPLAPKSSLI